MMKLPRWLSGTNITPSITSEMQASALIPVSQGPTNKEVYDNLLEIAKYVEQQNPMALHDLIKLILRVEQSELMLHVAEYGMIGKEDRDGHNFFGVNIFDHFSPEQTMPVERSPKQYILKLGRDIVLPCTWHDGRIIDALSYIGSEKPENRGYTSGPWRQDDNHKVHLWLPWRIGFVEGGNHSLTAGILAAEGEVQPVRVLDYSCLCRVMDCNGVDFLDSDGVEIAPVTDARRAAVYKIGCMIARLDERKSQVC